MLPSRKTNWLVKPEALAGLAGVLLIFVGAGCGEPKKEAAAKKTEAPAPAQASATPVPAATNAPLAAMTKSVFTTNPPGRDPFFPQSKRLAQAVASAAGAAQIQKSEPAVPSVASKLVLQGLAANKFAILNGTLIEPGRRANISVNSDGKTVKVKILCLKVLRDSVEISIEGQPAITVHAVSRF